MKNFIRVLLFILFAAICIFVTLFSIELKFTQREIVFIVIMLFGAFSLGAYLIINEELN